MMTDKPGCMRDEINHEVEQLLARDQTASLLDLVLAHQESLNTDPNNLETLVRLGHLHSYCNEFSAALSWYQQALAIQPLRSDICCCMGDALLGLGQAQQAQACFENVLNSQPNDVCACIGLGLAYTDQSDFQSAIYAYQKALFFGAQAGFVWLQVGDLWGELKQWPNAIASYHNALLRKADDPEIYYKLGTASIRTNNTSEAIKAYQKAVVLRPTFTAAHLAMGNAFALEKSFERAIACYTAVIQQDKHNLEAYKNLATLFSAQGNDAGVAFCDRHLHELAESGQNALPGLPTSVSLQPQARRELPVNNLPLPAPQPLSQKPFPQTGENAMEGQRDSSIVALKGGGDEGGVPNPLLSVASLVADSPVVTNDALSALYQAIEQNPNSAKNYAQLADALTKQGDVHQAIAFYKIALKLSPKDFQIALQLQKSLTALKTGLSDASASISTPSSSRAPFFTSPLSSSPLSSTPSSDSGLPGFPASFKFPPIVGEHNDYTFICDRVHAKATSAQPYHLPVSIIIPTYNRKEKLAKTLATLTHQTYPQQLIEVIVADDGSSDGVEAVIEKYQSHLDLVHVQQPDLGFRLAGVCNLGMQAAKHSFFIFLQCDMLPSPQLVEAYMQYFHVANNVFLIGGREFVCSDHITDDQVLADVETVLCLPPIKTNNEMWTGQKSWQDWRLPLYEQTDDLKKERYPYKAVVGSNLAFPKQLREQIGGFCEDFHDWGGEDREYGYRAFNAGYYLIPIHEAKGLHQEPPGGVNETDRRQGQKAAEAGCEAKCPLLPDRKYQPGRLYEVPKVSLFIIADDDTAPREQDSTGQRSDQRPLKQRLQASIESALTQTHTDLEICILCEANSSVTQMLEQHYAHSSPEHSRVRWYVPVAKTLSQAYNDAINLCRGAYIGQLVPGDILKPTAVETLAGCLDSETAGCAFANYQVVNPNGSSLRQIGLLPGDYSRESLVQTMLSHRFYLFRMRDWRKTPGCSIDLDDGADYDLALKLAQVCSFKYINQVLLTTQGDAGFLSVSPTPQQMLAVASQCMHRLEVYL